MIDLDQLALANSRRWKAMRVLPQCMPLVHSVALKLVGATAKARYQAVEHCTTVPWFIVAVIHERESSQSWAASLAQGDPWNLKSVHVPRNRGPFASWEEAAVDALVYCAPHAASNKDWSSGGALTLLEQYNGLGYFNRGLPSPYIWASTDQYDRGKFVADCHFDPHAVDHQLGCAALLKMMQSIDQSISVA